MDQLSVQSDLKFIQNIDALEFNIRHACTFVELSEL